jgi:hypothetical protein
MDQAAFISAILAAPLSAIGEYYAHCLTQSDTIDARLATCLGIDRDRAVERGIGLADRSLGTRLPSKQIRVGREVRELLIRIGLYKPNGRETLRGCLTEPLRDDTGKVIGIRGWPINGSGGPIVVGVDPQPSTSQPMSVHPPSPVASSPAAPSTIDDGIIIESNQIGYQQDDRHYRIRGLEKNTSCCQLKVNLLVTRQDLTYVDTVDLLKARSRLQFIRAVASELYVDEDLIKRDIGRLLRHLEARQTELLTELLAPQERQVTVSEPDRAAAMEYLRGPRLIDRIVDDMTAQGIIGERTTKLVAYLAMVSRKLEQPLALLIQSSSSAGKSSLMESVLALVPEEDQLRLSSLSSQSLYYWGSQSLRHKVLAISEDEGIHQAAYALKLLQSEGKLRHATVSKGENGRMMTQQYTVEGPVSLLLTTTRPRIDEELANRCLVISVDESPQQTAAIHHRQRQMRTLEARRHRAEQQAIGHLHHNVQRLLAPLVVCNPHSQQLRFGTERTRFRRDHAKYLTLIETIALLHQHQRTIHEQTISHSDDRQETMRYIDVEPSDIELADQLMRSLLHLALDDLAPQVRGFLQRLTEHTDEARASAKQLRITRRWISEQLGYSDFQVRSYLATLIDQEYIRVRRGKNGQRYEYELLESTDRCL